MPNTLNGSFAPLYIEPTRKLQTLMNLKDWRVTYFVLHELAHHANEIGTCYPGNRRLAELVGYAPAAVARSIGILHNHDYVKTHTIQNPITRRKDRIYQLSPWVLYIAPDHLDSALALWSKGSVEKILTLVEEPESINQNQNQNQQPESIQKQQQQSERAITPPPDAQAGEGPDTADRDGTDDTDQLIRKIVQLGTTEASARALMQKYNSREIRGGIRYISDQIASGANINNPVGLLTRMLARGECDPNYQSLKSSYVSGKYAAFINH